MPHPPISRRRTRVMLSASSDTGPPHHRRTLKRAVSRENNPGYPDDSHERPLIIDSESDAEDPLPEHQVYVDQPREGRGVRRGSRVNINYSLKAAFRSWELD